MADVSYLQHSFLSPLYSRAGRVLFRRLLYTPVRRVETQCGAPFFPPHKSHHGLCRLFSHTMSPEPALVRAGVTLIEGLAAVRFFLTLPRRAPPARTQ